MNILHLEASPGWGGQEIRILREAEGMRSRGHSVVIVVMTRGKLAIEACKAGFTVHELSFRKIFWPITFFRLLFIMRRYRTDIVNTHSSLDSWIGGLAARLLQIPVVRTRHLSTPVRPGMNSRLLYGSLADFVVTTCSSILPMISSQSKKPLSKMRCVATGVNPSLLQPMNEKAAEFRQMLKVSNEDFLVGTACFMRSWKGINDFLEAAQLLRNERRLHWVIIGGGHQEVYRQRAKDLNLNEIVHFTGHLPNPNFALQALDAFALLSTAHEGVSQALLQAAFLRKPLITTAVGGSGEICIDRVTGRLVPPFAPQKVAEVVLELMRDAESRRKWGDEAHELVINQYTLQHTLDGMEEVYREIYRGKK